MISQTRVLYLVLLLLVVIGYAAYTSPGSRLSLMLSGACFRTHAPAECQIRQMPPMHRSAGR